MSDGELDICLARTAGGDAGALHELYNELGSAVFAVARTITGDRQLAEDVLQDVFIKVFASANTYRKGGKPRAWVMRIARNQAISVLRKRRWEVAAGTDNTPDTRIESNTEAVPETVELNRALDTLARADREIVLLSVLGELSNREVASMLGIPKGSVSWRYRNALSKLKDLLSGFSL
jgi:RNA polymerase sigma factor (sigma-70 family)